MKKSTYSVKTSEIHSIRVMPDRIDWLKHGIPHRTDGPARIFNDGTKSWYIDGRLHRTDGPAVESEGITEWWVKGVQYSEEEFKIL